MLDHSTLDLGSVRLRAKDGLKFALRRRGNEVWYLVSDPVTTQFFRIGIAEATLLSLLNGQRTVHEALALAAQSSDQAHLDEVAASGICNFLLKSGLVSTSESRSTQRLDSQGQSQLQAKRLQWLNPISISIPLFNPDRFFNWLNRMIGPAIGFPLAVVGSLIILFGLTRLWMEWDQLTLFRVRSFAANDWLWLIAGWLVVKLIHEIGHGLVCKRMGGRITQAGMVLFLFIPLPFINTSSAWSFARRTQRMAVAAAGVFFEMLIASLGMIVWSSLAPGPLRFHLEGVIFVSMVHTLIFNLNPLMKFDGYYLLIDVLELSNLAQQGRRFVASLAVKWFVDPTTELSHEGRLQNFIRLYGVAAQVWMVIVMLGLLIAANNLLEGVGLLLACLALTLWLIPLTVGIKRVLWIDGCWHRRRVKRFGISLGSLLMICGLLGYVVPAPPSLRAPVVIDYREQATLRASAPGFIEAIHVAPNDSVTKGDLLVEIANPELSLRRDAIVADIQRTEIQIRVAHDEQEIAKAMVLRDKIATMRKQLTELEELIAGLKVYASIDGEVTTPDLAQRVGGYLRVGDEILSLGDSRTLEAVALVKQSDIGHVDIQRTQPSRVEILGCSKCVNATVYSIAPRASSLVPHKAFAANYGGLLSVIASEESETRSGGLIQPTSAELSVGSNQSADGITLIEPRVKVRLNLEQDPAGGANPLRPGQIGFAYINAREQSFGLFLASGIAEWVRNQFKRAHGL